jgi:hypothetical protein
MSNQRKALKIFLFLTPALLLIVLAQAAYKGHADDRDVNALLAAYPKLKNTATDSCATCHRSGKVSDPEKPESSRTINHCDYCHMIHVQNGKHARETLNLYGAAYLTSGRSSEAIKKIASGDSDNDGFSNETEFLEETNPGVFESNPSAPIAPYRIYTGVEIREMSPVVKETVFMNTTHNKAGDFYNEYRGNMVYEILQAVGVTDSADSADFISLDGYERSYTLKELEKVWPQDAPVMGLSKEDLASCGWVNYNASGLEARKKLPGISIMLAFEENGSRIEKARMDPKTGRIVGVGPFRMVVPQFHISPPDMPQYFSEECRDKVAQVYHFNEDYDHNGGKCSFAIVAIRINPLPKGTRDFEWHAVRDQFVSDEKIVFFGALKVPENR